MIYQSDFLKLDSSNHCNVKAKDMFALALIIQIIFKVKSTIKVGGMLFWFDLKYDDHCEG